MFLPVAFLIGGAVIYALSPSDTEDDDETEKSSRSISETVTWMYKKLHDLAERHPKSGRRAHQLSWGRVVYALSVDKDKALGIFLPKDGPTDAETSVANMNRRVSELKKLKVDIRKTVARFIRQDGE